MAQLSLYGNQPMSSGAPPPVLSPFPLISTQFSKHWRTQTGLVVIYTQHQRRVPHPAHPAHPARRIRRRYTLRRRHALPLAFPLPKPSTTRSGTAGGTRHLLALAACACAAPTCPTCPAVPAASSEPTHPARRARHHAYACPSPCAGGARGARLGGAPTTQVQHLLRPRPCYLLINVVGVVENIILGGAAHGRKRSPGGTHDEPAPLANRANGHREGAVDDLVAFEVVRHRGRRVGAI